MSWWIHVQPVDDAYPNHEVNVTYNVGSMLKRAGVHPRLLNEQTVAVVRPVIANARVLMMDNERYFEQFNPTNGWGSVEGVLTMLGELDRYLTDAPDDYVMRWH